MNEDQRDKTCREMIYRLVMRARKDSLISMRAEDMAKFMDVSKVTMYKYFSSKEEILSLVISTYTDYMRNVDISSADENEAILERYQKSFEQSLMINYYFPEHFLNDFKAYNSRLYEEIVDAQQFRFKQLDELYRLGAEQGIFYPVNSAIFILDDELILRRILDPSFLVQHGLPLEKTLLDYYEMQKRKLIREKHLNIMDNSRIEELIRSFVAKNSRNL
ncbi:TetR/AcrR family transcriptional regulator [Priestia megaterium]|uniref:TetR/AcrR family transcriptional regulator n=1 Tax=Priestia megaterium TaxID=1404 RepID=A0A3D8WZI5_PRIMG|nr:TetR/AcrR family transcriptional regulator [Priestia megaterium]MDH3168725.1 TetR/AcrR family transcriptional regulator [Priestia megaterium]MED4292933.1 TetR/AcrR family transcriptional regulator [Priestia megaterium]MED4297774.1 TetR/AcrR family transcriptional regulator [Priestia megaterium]RDZ12479.1 TetR/AcrR family transcriptional regulator [Priestia megaterium]